MKRLPQHTLRLRRLVELRGPDAETNTLERIDRQLQVCRRGELTGVGAPRLCPGIASFQQRIDRDRGDEDKTH